MDPYLGEIRLFAGSFAPRGWALCNGQQLPINGNEALYSLIGATYGGNGSTIFCLPDLRGRIPAGSGQGTGLTNRPLGTQFGSEKVTLSGDQMPAHTHTLQVSGNAAPAPITPLQSPYGQVPAAPSLATAKLYHPATGASPTPMAQETIASCAGGAAHENRMPLMAINFIICTQGIYPDFQ